MPPAAIVPASSVKFHRRSGLECRSTAKPFRIPPAGAAWVLVIATVAVPAQTVDEVLLASGASVLRVDLGTDTLIDVFAPSGNPPFAAYSASHGLDIAPTALGGDVFVTAETPAPVRGFRFRAANGSPAGQVFEVAGAGNFGYGGVFGPDGRYYFGIQAGVGIQGVGSVWRWDPATQVTAPFVPEAPAGSPGRLGSPRAIAFGPDGNLYVSCLHQDPALNKVQRHDGATGAYLATVAPPATAGGIVPDGIAFGPDGRLYVADQAGNRVLRMEPGAGASPGTLIGTFVAPGAGGLNAPGGVGFGPDGHFYVASQLGSALLRFHGTTGIHLGVVHSGAPVGKFAFRRRTLTTLAPSGRRLITSWGQGRLVAIDPVTAAATPIDPMNAAGIGSSAGLAIGPGGRLYVSDAPANRVLWFDLATASFGGVFVATVGPPGSWISGLAFGPAGDLYVAMETVIGGLSHGSVYRYSGARSLAPAGALVPGPVPGPNGEFIPVAAGVTAMGGPRGIAVSPEGELLVSCVHQTAAGQRIQKYDAGTGTLLDPDFAPNTGLEPAGPHQIALLPGCELLVGCTWGIQGASNQILRYSSATGAFLGIHVPSGHGGLDVPIGVAAGRDGHTYAASYTSGAILRFDTTSGTFRDQVFSGGSLGLVNPLYLAFERGFELVLDQPQGPGSLRVMNVLGPPGNLYFSAFSANPANACPGQGMGWWGGLHLTVPELFALLSLGIPPVLGVLDAAGASTFLLPGGALPPLPVPIYGVTHAFDPAQGHNLSATTAVARIVIH